MTPKAAGAQSPYMLEFTRYTYLESRGWSELNKPVYEKRMWNDDDSFFKAPTIRGVVDIGMSILGNIIAPGIGGVLFGLIDDLVFTAADVSGGYKEAGTAWLDFGKKAAGSVVTSAIGGIGIGSSLGGALGGGFVGTSLGKIGEQVVTNTATGAINAIELKDGKLGWNAGTFQNSLVGTNALAGYGGSFAGTMFSGGVNSALGGVESGFLKGAVNLGSSVVRKGAELAVHGLANPGASFGQIWDASGGLSVNVLDLGAMAGMLTGGKLLENYDAKGIVDRDTLMNVLGGTGINLNIMSGGVSASFGQGSNIGLMSNISSLVQGLQSRSYAQKESERLSQEIDDPDKRAAVQRSLYEGFGYSYTIGDPVLQATLTRLRKGVDSLEINVDIEVETNNEKNSDEVVKARALTTANKEGNRTIQLAGVGSGAEFAIDLSHEAWRDGVLGDNQNQETVQAVLAHTKMAAAMVGEVGLGFLLGRGDLVRDLMEYQRLGPLAFAQYVYDTYDSSADYWKLVQTDTGNWKWQEDESLDFDISELPPEQQNVVKEILKLEGSSLTSDGRIRHEDMKGMVLDVLSLNLYPSLQNQPGVFVMSPETMAQAEAIAQFKSGTSSLVNLSKNTQSLIDLINSGGNERAIQNSITVFNNSMLDVERIGILDKTTSQINTGGLVNLGSDEQPVYVPVRLGAHQNTHESTSDPGLRIIDPKRGITNHSGIDLGGNIGGVDIVAAAKNSTASLRWDNTWGLSVINSFNYDGASYMNSIGHAAAQDTVMAMLKVLGTSGVTMTQNGLTGILAGTPIGTVGNTGYSFGAHADLRTYEYNNIGNRRLISPLNSNIYGDYFTNQIYRKPEVTRLSNLPGATPEQSWRMDETWDRIFEHLRITNDYAWFFDLGMLP